MGSMDVDTPAAMTASTRRWIDVGVIVLAFAAAAATAIEPGSTLRALVVLAAFLLVPGWAAVSLLPSGPPAAMLGLAIGLSLAVEVAGGLLLVFTEAISIVVLAVIVGVAAVGLLLADVARQAQLAHDPSAPPPATS